jgi:hypothetical protein
MRDYFHECTTIQEAKKLYHQLIREHHPDAGGSTEACQEIVGQFQAVAQRLVYGAYHAYKANAGYDTSGADEASYTFAKVLRDIVNYDIHIEIIGYWIYAFDSFEYREQLKEHGFWFSKKHKAWVYSGEGKKKIRSRYTTDDVRNIHGSQTVREKEPRQSIA